MEGEVNRECEQREKEGGCFFEVCGSRADLRGKLVVVKDRLKRVCVLCKVWQLRFVVGRK